MELWIYIVSLINCFGVFFFGIRIIATLVLFLAGSSKKELTMGEVAIFSACLAFTIIQLNG